MAGGLAAVFEHGRDVGRRDLVRVDGVGQRRELPRRRVGGVASIAGRGLDGPVGAVSEPHRALGGVLAGETFGVAFAAPNPTAVFG